ncbi:MULTISPECIES: ABC transporter ATP-binding protein [Haloferax]|uniref:Nickel import system ATP-binding protein NikD n=1 Tax=Haloferax marinum TaxID=2666143 RepID=A0A6A8G6I4_9EURY|nr:MULTISPECIES: ABC transporter ATP-binding protein [Haloferax]KAB1197657.1 ABC transporter ATP-binding protein [Haloferax sp. CBA1150]MRW96709.1 ATP-binding cassette domain-containing protein [Haloferax marinum]
MSTEQPTETRQKGEPILSVENVRTSFYTDKEVIRAVDGVSFDIYRGETVGIVGESGSGKSVTARSIMRLVDNPGRIENGRIMYDGENLLDKKPKQMRAIRGGSIAMVFQDPLTSLNPVYTVGNQIKESLRLHRGMSGKEATKEAIELLEAVGIPDAHRRIREYPHQFSGGMRQRAVIAMALACDPELLICDEPTTALDVTIQAQILELLEDIQEERDLAIMFITHDMGVIAEIADRVNVMYAGEIVESAPAVELFESPKHPYTQGLLNSIPGQGLEEGGRLSTIEGDVPTPNEEPTYCRFAPRCPKAFAECDTVHPVPVEVGDDSTQHQASCLLYPKNLSKEEALDVHRERGAKGGDQR